MKRSKLENKTNKTKLITDVRNYKKQRNYVVNLNKNAKFEYFSRYDCKDGKPFWINCKPYFSHKHRKCKKTQKKPKKVQVPLMIISALLLKTLT